MTYKQAYDKIIDAYFKDEIKPNSFTFCFCGTLHGGENWGNGDNFYKAYQYLKMEEALFSGFPDESRKNIHGTCFEEWCAIDCENRIDDYENKLFAGMCAALDVLKQIHTDRGEVIDPLPTFTKRVFSDVLKMVK